MTFTKRSIEALKAYWCTAAVLDDAAQPGETAPAMQLQTPGRGEVRGTQEAEQPAEFQGPSLDVPALVDAFLKQDILCAVYSRKDVLTKSIAALLRSDILVLDWKLGDDGTMAAQFVSDCSSRYPNALRMICIYTSENDLGAIWEKLQENISGLQEIPDKNGAYFSGSTYILVVNKGSSTGSRAADVNELPELLLKEFAPIVGGLLRNAVFHSIGAIRDNIHALLDRFPPDIDPAFVTHRVYSYPCEDTEQHIIPLISSEISSILAQKEIPRRLNSEQILCWLELGNGHATSSGLPDDVKNIIIEKKIEIIEKGITDVGKQIKCLGKKQVLRDSQLTTLWGAQSGPKSDAMLARLMSCEHRYSDVDPVLKSGTLLKLNNPNEKNKYFLCIQPPCDCVRIEEDGRHFIFAHVSKCSKTEKFDFAFINLDETITYLAMDKKTYKATFIKFRPSDGKKCIVAKKDSDACFFTDTAQNKYEFLFQLNELHALRAIREYSNNLSRIGLMESDWQRRCARGEHL